jgi:Plasmid encoded RepA protein
VSDLPEASPDIEATLDKATRLYTDLGFTAERIAAQLIRSGYPIELVRQRFPDIPATSLPQPSQARAARRASSRATTSESRTAGKEPPSNRPTQLVLQSVMDKVGVTATQTSVTTDRDLQTATTGVDADGVSFQYVPLIQCSFPHTDPGEQTTFTRRNGWLELTLSSGHPGTGLPYGVPARLLTIYCASEAIRTRSPEIFLGSSVHDFLRRLDVPITRGDRGTLRIYANQLLRLIHCAISIDENIRDMSGRTGLHIRQALFAEEARLWWDEANGVGQGSSLILSSVLFQSILERSAPLSTTAIRQLRRSPMDLDVYAWLVHRLFHLSKPSTMTWAQLSGQFGHSYGELRYFRRFFVDSLKRVQKVYPEARLKWTDTGLMLLPSKPHVDPRLRSGGA